MFRATANSPRCAEGDVGLLRRARRRQPAGQVGRADRGGGRRPQRLPLLPGRAHRARPQGRCLGRRNGRGATRRVERPAHRGSLALRAAAGRVARSGRRGSGPGACATPASTMPRWSRSSRTWRSTCSPTTSTSRSTCRWISRASSSSARPDRQGGGAACTTMRATPPRGRSRRSAMRLHPAPPCLGRIRCSWPPRSRCRWHRRRPPAAEAQGADPGERQRCAEVEPGAQQRAQHAGRPERRRRSTSRSSSTARASAC